MSAAAAAFVLGTSTLWDYRIFDIRVFDFVAIVSLVGYLVINRESLSGFFERRRDYAVLFVTIIAYAILGFVLNKHRSSAAILVFGPLCFVLIGRRDWIVSARLFTYLLAAHVAFFLIQLFSFQLLNVMIDFHTLTGAQSRIDQGLAQGIHQIRASGLFQEPNSYALNMFVLGSLATLLRVGLPMIALAAATMALSQSLWGIAAACVLLLLYGIMHREMLKRTLIAALVFAAAVNGYLWLSIRPHETVPFTYTRAMRMLTDTSARVRFVRNECPDEVQAANAAGSQEIASVLFGQGLSTHYFRQCLAANGISFLLKSLGLIGLAALLAGFGMALRGLPASAKLYAIVAIGFSFTTYPLVTYLLFWLWLAAVINLLRLVEADRGAASRSSTG